MQPNTEGSNYIVPVKCPYCEHLENYTEEFLEETDGEITCEACGEDFDAFASADDEEDDSED